MAVPMMSVNAGAPASLEKECYYLAHFDFFVLCVGVFCFPFAGCNIEILVLNFEGETFTFMTFG